jgi:hypothetical protein
MYMLQMYLHGLNDNISEPTIATEFSKKTKVLLYHVLQYEPGTWGWFVQRLRRKHEFEKIIECNCSVLLPH